jgi:hypothetical protein
MITNVAITGSSGRNSAAWTDAFIAADFVCPISVFARWHADIEDSLRASGVAHVILRPNFFMQNALLQQTSIEAGVHSEPLETAAISYVDIRDVADVAVVAAGGNLDDEALTLTGPEASGGERVSAVLSQATGKEVRFVSPHLASFRDALAAGKVPGWHIDALADLYARVQAGWAPHTSAVTADIENVIGRPPRNFQEFADAFGGRRSPRRPARSQVSARIWHHLFTENLARGREWPIGCRL